jgi:ribosome-binding protein aMBF1 (putative translation factor)
MTSGGRASPEPPLCEKIEKIRRSNDWTMEYLAEKTDQSLNLLKRLEMARWCLQSASS